jgi:hypothetical protein
MMIAHCKPYQNTISSYAVPNSAANDATCRSTAVDGCTSQLASLRLLPLVSAQCDVTAYSSLYADSPTIAITATSAASVGIATATAVA